MQKSTSIELSLENAVSILKSLAVAYNVGGQTGSHALSKAYTFLQQYEEQISLKKKIELMIYSNDTPENASGKILELIADAIDRYITEDAGGGIGLYYTEQPSEWLRAKALER